MKRIALIFVLLAVASSVFIGCSDKASIYDCAAILREVKTTQFFTDDSVSETDIKLILEAGVNAPSAMNTQPWHFTAVTDTEIAQMLADEMGNMKPPAGFAPPENDNVSADMPQIPEIPNGVDVPGEMPVMPEIPENTPIRPEGKPEGMPTMGEGAPNGGRFASNKKAGIGDAPLTIVISCTNGNELSAGLAVQNMSAEAQLLGYGTKIMTAPTMGLNTEEYYSLLSIPEGHKIVAVLIVGVPATEDENPDVTASATTRNDFETVVTLIK